MLQILRNVPGLTVIQSGSRGGTTTISTRGGNVNMNQVLIDGMKVNAGGGAFDFANLTTVGIGRAEVVRGPQSALYGADAMTSVLQFFTPRGEGPLSIWGSAKGGNYSTDEERIGASWGTVSAAPSSSSGTRTPAESSRSTMPSRTTRRRCASTSSRSPISPSR